MSVSTSRRHECARCGRKVSAERSIYSRHTGSRYCYVGEGCFGKRAKRRAKA